MKAIRPAGAFLVVLALSVCLSACSKKEEATTSSVDSLNSTAMGADSLPPEASMVVPTTENNPEPPGGTATTPTKSKPKTQTTPAAAEKRTVSLPTGATFIAEMITPINTSTSNVGDKIEAKLVDQLSSPDGGGAVIAEAGSHLKGEIVELKRASHAKSEDDRAMVKMAFTSLETVDGEKTLEVTVTNAEGRMIAGSTTKRDALIIGGSAIAGAVLGKVVGKDTKGAVIGAVGGAVLGTGAVMAAKGYELDVPAGSKLSLRVDAPISVVTR
jgi:hypothetical protein